MVFRRDGRGESRTMGEAALTIMVMALMAAALLLFGVAWLRGSRNRWLQAGLRRWVTLHVRGDLPVLIRNLPFAAVPLSLVWCAGAQRQR